MLIGQAHRQFLSGFTIAGEIQSTDWSGLGHVTTLGIEVQVHSYQTTWSESGSSSMENYGALSRRGNTGQIKTHVYLGKPHLECRDRESKSCTK